MLHRVNVLQGKCGQCCIVECVCVLCQWSHNIVDCVFRRLTVLCMLHSMGSVLCGLC